MNPDCDDYYMSFENYEHQRRQAERYCRIITEAYCLLEMIVPGEAVDAKHFERGILHLKSVLMEFPGMDDSQAAHRLARRLQLQPATPNLLARLKVWLLGRNSIQ
jgi:hypothetical protein